MKPAPNKGQHSDSSIASSLLMRVRSNDPDAWARIVQIYGPLIYQWCLRAGISKEESADVGQEVFRSVMQSIDRFRRDRESDTFVGWLRTVCRRRIVDHQRRMMAQPRAIGGTTFLQRVTSVSHRSSLVPGAGGGKDAAEADADEMGTDEIRSIVVTRVMDLLKTDFKENTWKAFWGTVVEQRSTKDVALDLGMSAMAVRKAKSRVLQRLRVELGDDLASGL